MACYSVPPHLTVGWEQTRGRVAWAPKQLVVFPAVASLSCTLLASPARKQFTFDGVTRDNLSEKVTLELKPE